MEDTIKTIGLVALSALAGYGAYKLLTDDDITEVTSANLLDAFDHDFEFNVELDI